MCAVSMKYFSEVGIAEDIDTKHEWMCAHAHHYVGNR